MSVFGSKIALRAFWSQIRGAGGKPPDRPKAVAVFFLFAADDPRENAEKSYRGGSFFERFVFFWRVLVLT